MKKNIYLTTLQIIGIFGASILVGVILGFWLNGDLYEYGI